MTTTFADVDVAAVIHTVDRERNAQHAFDAATTAGMPDDIYYAAYHYASRVGLIETIGRYVGATHRGRVYARRTMATATYTRDMVAHRSASPTPWAATSDDFDGPNARTPGTAVRS